MTDEEYEDLKRKSREIAHRRAKKNKRRSAEMGFKGVELSSNDLLFLQIIPGAHEEALQIFQAEGEKALMEYTHKLLLEFNSRP